MNGSEKARKVREMKEELVKQFPSGDCLLVSLPSETHTTKGGMIVEVSLGNAARQIVEQTHRIATENEIDEYRAQQDAQRRKIHAAQLAQPDLLKALLGRAIEMRVPESPVPVTNDNKEKSK